MLKIDKNAYMIRIEGKAIFFRTIKGMRIFRRNCNKFLTTDFSMYEGKLITVQYCNIETYTGKVVACDMDIGITVVNNNNPSHYLYCVTGPFAANGEDFSHDNHYVNFFRRIEEIEQGEMFFSMRDVCASMNCPAPSAETCPFGQ